MTDILLTDTYDLQIADGDFVTGFSDEQQQRLLLLCDKGSFKERPEVCVGLQNYLEGEDPALLLSEIRRQFAGDGMAVNDIQITDGKIMIDARYS